MTEQLRRNMEGNFCIISVELLFVKPHWYQSYYIFSFDAIASKNVKFLFDMHVLESKERHTLRSGCFLKLHYHLDKKGADHSVFFIAVYKQVACMSLPTLKRFLY